MIKKIQKAELPALILVTLLCLLANFQVIPFIVYLIISVLIAVYFNPIKSLYLIQSREENKFNKFFAMLVISSSIIISFMWLTSTYITSSLNVMLYLLIIFNSILVYSFLKSQDQEAKNYRNLLFINLILLIIPLFN